MWITPFVGYNCRMKLQKKIIVGNWKMNVATVKEAQAIVRTVKKKTLAIRKTDVVFCPPAVYFADLKKSVQGSKKYRLGAQNVSSEEKGSFTGEISATLVKQFGVSHVILGHSERRKMGETDEMIGKKVREVLRMKMTPIFCIGETVRNDDGDYLQFIKGQITKVLRGLSNAEISEVIIAYEPVWAIGATQAMGTHDIHEMTLYIKKCLREIFKEYGGQVAILYGGAVNTENALEIVTDGFVDGLLIGRDSLEPQNFVDIIKMVDAIK